MSEATIGYDQADEEVLSYEVSDEALETASQAGKGKGGNFTLAFCSGVATCPM